LFRHVANPVFLMTRILIAGYQHETNTFAPSLADWAAFNCGESFPAYMRGQTVIDQMTGINMPISGFMDAAKRWQWDLVPSVWAGATPSSYVTQDAFEKIASAILEDIRNALPKGLDGIYLDLHGAAVAEHADDSEGELLARIRQLVGPSMPIVASLDLHANVTQGMLAQSDALVSYRTYPHIDMANTGELAAQLMQRRLKLGRKEPMFARRFPFLISLNAQSTWMEPAKTAYEQLLALDRESGVMLSFCMGFPASDFDECGPVVWGHGQHAEKVVEQLFAAISEPSVWRPQWLPAREAVVHALATASRSAAPVVIADTQDNPGAGGDSNTTGMLHALLQQGAGKAFPGQVALGLMFDPDTAQMAFEAGVGAQINCYLGKAVPIFTGQLSDPPLQGRFTVKAISDGRCVLKGPMMTGVAVQMGPSACLEIEGILIAVVSGKVQLLDRELLRTVGIHAEQMKLVVVKSSNHFRADFTPIASEVLIAKAPGPMAADPADLPWQKLNPLMRRQP
jgi:microcystin degradation protein MlrC